MPHPQQCYTHNQKQRFNNFILISSTYTKLPDFSHCYAYTTLVAQIISIKLAQPTLIILTTLPPPYPIVEAQTPTFRYICKLQFQTILFA